MTFVNKMMSLLLNMLSSFVSFPSKEQASFNLMGALIAQLEKNLPVLQETRVRSLGREDPLEKEMATHSSTLAWKIPWRARLVGYSPWGRKESDMTE